MRNLLSGLILTVSLSASAVAAAPQELLCREESGGWCESGGPCYVNTKPPADFRFFGVIPDELGTQKAVLNECRSGECGPDWEVEFRRGLGPQLTASRLGEQWTLDLGSGFFSHASVVSAETLGRVSYAFGHCKLPAAR